MYFLILCLYLWIELVLKISLIESYTIHECNVSRRIRSLLTISQRRNKLIIICSSGKLLRDFSDHPPLKVRISISREIFYITFSLRGHFSKLIPVLIHRFIYHVRYIVNR